GFGGFSVAVGWASSVTAACTLLPSSDTSTSAPAADTLLILLASEGCTSMWHSPGVSPFTVEANKYTTRASSTSGATQTSSTVPDSGTSPTIAAPPAASGANSTFGD